MTTLLGTPEIQTKRKQSMLPVLTVLFVLSYGLMTLLIVEQGSTIESQRAMIRLLLGDSSQLFAMKAKNAQKQALAAQPAPTNRPAQTQTPSTQAPSTQAQPKPSEKSNLAHKGAKLHRRAPLVPPMPTSDMADARKTLMSI